jgi:TnpA family transposase
MRPCTWRRGGRSIWSVAPSAQARRLGSFGELRACVNSIQATLDEPDLTAEIKLSRITEYLAPFRHDPSGTQAGQIRQALAEDTGAVRALMSELTALPFEGRENDAGLQQVQALKKLYDSKATTLPSDSPVQVGRVWRALTGGEDRKRALRAFEASAMLSLRTSLRRGSAWLPHSQSFRERDRLLIPPAQWEAQREGYFDLLGQPGSPDEFLARLREHLAVSLAALAEAAERGAVGIGDGEIRIPALKALDVTSEPRRVRDQLFKTIGDVQLPDLLIEVDALTGFSQALLARRAANERELIAIYAALLAHGTEIDAKAVAAMTPGIEPPQVSAAMRTLELPGRLRRANQIVLDFQGQSPLAQLWGDGTRASADMMSLDASAHLWSARTDPRRRTYAIGLYTHVLNRHGVIYDMPIVLNERQAGAAIEGVERYNAEMRGLDRLRLQMLSVDTHGYTHVAMAVAKLLGFDLCPRLSTLAERKLYIPRNLDVPRGLESLLDRSVSLGTIADGWDELLRLAASIQSGRVGADLALRRLGSAARGDRMHRAAEALGKLLRTIFLCDYFAQPPFRREIHTLLNRGESVHQLQRAIYYGRIAPERGRRADEMMTISGAHALLTNVVLAWNVHRMQAAVQTLRRRGVAIEDDWLRRMGPAHFGHINFRGTFRFAVEKHAQALLKPPVAERSSANG